MKDRHLLHKEFNEVLKKFCELHSNCYIVDVNKFIGANSYYDTINHYKKEIYYRISLKLKELLCSINPMLKIENKGKLYLTYLKFRLFASNVKKHLNF